LEKFQYALKEGKYSLKKMYAIAVDIKVEKVLVSKCGDRFGPCPTELRQTFGPKQQQQNLY
jgi:hypothetical protein